VDLSLPQRYVVKPKRPCRSEPLKTGTRLIKGGTFKSDTDGTFHSDTPGTFESDTGGTFESDIGGTFKLMPSLDRVTPTSYIHKAH
jgi:hypothetical protein